MKIMGVHDGHNASACLLEDGELTWAVQEERYTQQKNQAGLPVNAITEISKHIRNLDCVALASLFIHEPEWYRTQSFWEYTRRDYYKNKLTWSFRKRLNPYFRNRLSTRIKQLTKILDDLGIECQEIVPVEHHTCHAASAFYGSHYLPGTSVTVLTADGSGDGLSATVSLGDEEGQLTRLTSSDRSASIGQVYSDTTYILGFRPWEHEYKLMGLAPYCRPDSKILKELSKLLDIKNGRFTANSSSMKFIYGFLMKLYRRKRFDVVCATLQRWFETMMRLWVESVEGNLFACAGGCFMNVKANQIIAGLQNVSDLFVFPSCGDESTSIGAAMHVQAQDCLSHGEHPKKKIQPVNSLALGSYATDKLLEVALKHSGFDYQRVKNPESYIVDLLSKRKIVARCSGRMEFGARALGNRSILCDASKLGLKQELNQRVKHRDFWMPFAPSVHDEDARWLFDNPKQLRAPYMTLAFNSTDVGRRDLSAAMHPYDYTLRPQIVEKGEGYWRLLDGWRQQTGRGGVLNTSFNRHGFPIVRGYKEALWTLENTGLQHLVLDDYVVVKK